MIYFYNNIQMNCVYYINYKLFRTCRYKNKLYSLF